MLKEGTEILDGSLEMYSVKSQDEGSMLREGRKANVVIISRNTKGILPQAIC